MTARIIEFPRVPEVVEEPRTCDQCVHYLSGVSGEYCRVINDDLFSIHEAVACDSYDAG